MKKIVSILLLVFYSHFLVGIDSYASTQKNLITSTISQDYSSFNFIDNLSSFSEGNLVGFQGSVEAHLKNASFGVQRIHHTVEKIFESESGLQLDKAMEFHYIHQFIESFSDLTKAERSGQVWGIVGLIGSGKSYLSNKLKSLDEDILLLELDRFKYSRSYNPDNRSFNDRSRGDSTFERKDFNFVGKVIQEIRNRQDTVIPFWNHHTGNRFYIEDQDVLELVKSSAEKDVFLYEQYQLVKLNGLESRYPSLSHRKIHSDSIFMIDRNSFELVEVLPGLKAPFLIVEGTTVKHIPRTQDLFTKRLFVYRTKEDRLKGLMEDHKSGKRYAHLSSTEFQERVIEEYFGKRDQHVYPSVLNSDAFIYAPYFPGNEVPEELNKSRVFVLLGTNGVGKSTLISKLLREKPDKVYRIKRITTREKRENDNSSFYEHISQEEFDELDLSGQLIFRNIKKRYSFAVKKEEWGRALSSGKVIVLESFSARERLLLDAELMKNIEGIYTVGIIGGDTETDNQLNTLTSLYRRSNGTAALDTLKDRIYKVPFVLEEIARLTDTIFYNRKFQNIDIIEKSILEIVDQIYINESKDRAFIGGEENSLMNLSGESAGGQFIRYSLAFSSLLNKNIQLSDIRLHRRTKGLRYSHVAAIELLKNMTNAEVSETRFGTTDFIFKPRIIKRGKYRIDLPKEYEDTESFILPIFQAVLPVALFADGITEIEVVGRAFRNNEMVYEQFSNILIPLLNKYFGLRSEISFLSSPTFDNQNKVSLKVFPQKEKLPPITFDERGDLERVSLNLQVSLMENQEGNVLELKESILNKLQHLNVPLEFISDVPIHLVDSSEKEGISLFLQAQYSRLSLGFGQSIMKNGKGFQNISRELLNGKTFRQFEAFHSSEAVLDENLADMLLPYLVLTSGRSGMKVGKMTHHLETSIALINQFLPVLNKIQVESLSSGQHVITVNGIGYQSKLQQRDNIFNAFVSELFQEAA